MHKRSSWANRSAASSASWHGLSHTKYAVGCASGTDALLLALRALDIGPGHEVITTPFTFFATAGTIHNVGATPVFVDIDPVTFNIDPDLIQAAVTPRTRAVIPVDLFGQMAEIERVAAAVPGLPTIEDAAQSVGARRSIDGEWRMAGEVATIGTLSFFPSKNLGGYGDGGMMVTQNEGLYRRLLRLRTHGSVKTYYHEEVGFNSRLDALQAAILRAKLPHLAGWSAQRRAHAAYYTQALQGLTPHVRPPVVSPANESIFNQYTIRCERRDALQAHLDCPKDRVVHLLSIASASPAVLRLPGLSRGSTAGRRAGGSRSPVVARISRADDGAAG